MSEDSSITVRTDASRHMVRDRLEVLVDVLRLCEPPGADITTIMGNSLMGRERAKHLIGKLTARRLLTVSQTNPNRYVVTDRGRRFRNCLTPTINILEERQRHDIRRRARKEKTSLPVNIE
ncbi:MAG: winged helix-turn-helix domain-containing protein [Thaumarchaeota archaeon]|nr:winged helix-turn-helix domain-containing protein [Nitrososphaerota archaeon]